MQNDAVMTINERRKYLLLMQLGYHKAGRGERSHLLDDMELVTRLHRKSLIRLMEGSLERRPRQRQRARSYAPEVDDAVRLIWESLDYVCAERLTPSLVAMASQLAEHGEMNVSDPLVEQLARISVSTVQRILKRIGQDMHRRRRKPSGPANLVAREIPIRRIAWNIAEPGHFEVDLTYHSGANASGDFMCTMQMIDVTTGWSERAAVLGRSFLVMRDAFLRVQARLPIPIRELHPDNGLEFLNWNLVRFWQRVFQGVQFSRSFPYHKNDNRFVEQKNATLVRAYLGFERLDSVAQVNAVNQLLDLLWIYNNFFQPVMRLAEKIVEPSEHGSHVKRRYDRAKTPLDRLCESGAIPLERQEELQRRRDQFNPRQLREDVYDLIDRIFRLPNAEPGQYEDVAQTLFQSLDPSHLPDQHPSERVA